jgi:hypothetical protein
LRVETLKGKISGALVEGTLTALAGPLDGLFAECQTVAGWTMHDGLLGYRSSV